MTDEYIREGDIVEIDYITEFTKEHINEGKALVIWKGFNNQPLVRKLDTKATIWTCYEHIARVVGHIDIVGYMDRALSTEPCEDSISRQAVLDALVSHKYSREFCEEHHIDWSLNLSMALITINDLPSVTPKEKTGKWIRTTDKSGHLVWECGCGWQQRFATNFCPDCGAKMIEQQESEDKK